MWRQAEDRVHRIGQMSPVTVHYLLGAATIDELLWPLLKRKAAIVGHTLEGAASSAGFGVPGLQGSVDGDEHKRSWQKRWWPMPLKWMMCCAGFTNLPKGLC